MTKSRLVKVAKEAYLHAGAYAYNGRHKKKSEFRKLWIIRISQYLKNNNYSYSKFISGLKKSNINLDRKILAYLILNDEYAFKSILDKVRKN